MLECYPSTQVKCVTRRHLDAELEGRLFYTRLDNSQKHQTCRFVPITYLANY